MGEKERERERERAAAPRLFMQHLRHGRGSLDASMAAKPAVRPALRFVPGRRGAGWPYERAESAIREALRW